MRLIDAKALKKVLSEPLYRSTIKDYGEILKYTFVMDIIDNAPTVIWCSETSDGLPLMDLRPRPQGEYVDISKLRLMTVEECTGHTIDYAMGWKACIEWIKKGGAEC